MPLGKAGLPAGPCPPLSTRGGTPKSAVLAKALLSEPWTYCLSLCSVRAEESGCRLWQPASTMACDDPHVLGSRPDRVPSHTLPGLVCATDRVYGSASTSPCVRVERTVAAVWVRSHWLILSCSFASVPLGLACLS